MLRFVESFDHSTSPSPKWDGTSNQFFAVQVGVAGRFGTAGGQAANLGGGVLDSRAGAFKDLGGSESTWTVGFAAQIYGASNGNPVLLMGLYEIGNGFHTGIWVDSNRRLLVRRNVTTLATYAPVISNLVYHYFEFQSTIHDTLGSYELRMDGMTILSASSVDTRNGGSGYADRIHFSGGINSGDGAVFAYACDDIYMLDSVDSGVGGMPNNTFLGDVKVSALFPNGNGNSSLMLGSDGNSVNNYLLVDETSPNGDTDYVESATVSNKDTYAYTDLTTTTGSIYGVQILPYVRKTDAGTRKIASIARLSATEVDSADRTLNSGYAYFPDVRETKPGGGQWAIADVNSAEFGVKVTV